MLDFIKVQFIKFITLFKKYKRPTNELFLLDGVYKDKDDPRDYVVDLDLPHEVKYTILSNPYKYVKNQSSWNSCASHAISTAIEISHELQKTNKVLPLSERFHYYYARQPGYMDNYPENEGQTARIMMRVAQEIGMAPEKLCPDIPERMNDEPEYFAKGFANMWKIKHYFRVIDLENAKSFICAGYPICVGFLCNKSFVSFTEEINLDKPEYGGHEVVIYGYDDATQELLCINSWGSAYKDSGCMRVPYEYYNKYGIDMWTFDI